MQVMTQTKNKSIMKWKRDPSAPEIFMTEQDFLAEQVR